jgi:hypothetical protein
METAIKIGAEVSKESAKNLGDLISTIFKVGKQSGMEQATVCKALDLVNNTLSVNGTSINNCNINGDKNYS